MKKLGKLKLSDAKVMDIREMKVIIGGQVISDSCRNTGTSTGLNGDTADIVCSGKCPTETVTGNTAKQKCQKDTFVTGGNAIVSCICK